MSVCVSVCVCMYGCMYMCVYVQCASASASAVATMKSFYSFYIHGQDISGMSFYQQLRLCGMLITCALACRCERWKNDIFHTRCTKIKIPKPKTYN